MFILSLYAVKILTTLIKTGQQTTRLCDLKIRPKMLHKTCNIKAVQGLFSGENNISVNCCRKRFLLLGTKQLCSITNKFQEIWRHHLCRNCDSRKINSTYELTWEGKCSCLCGYLSFVGLVDYWLKRMHRWHIDAFAMLWFCITHFEEIKRNRNVLTASPLGSMVSWLACGTSGIPSNLNDSNWVWNSGSWNLSVI